MKYFITLFLVLTLGAGCKQKILAGKELDDKLKETMTEYLHKTMRPGTEVKIRELTYYADKERKLYVCAFSVDVHSGSSDTTGVMNALIPNDFSKVTRTQ
jgi:hypothetical protein